MINAGRNSRNNFKVHTAVDRVMAGLLCYSEGILLVELRKMCADFNKVTTNFSQTAISINFAPHFCRIAPRSTLRPCFFAHSRLQEQSPVLKIWENYITELHDRPNRPVALEVESEEEVDADEKGPYIL
jgi:hypothetical protein